MRSLFATTVAALALAGSVSAATWVGCVNNAPAGATPKTAASQGACDAACAGSKFSYFKKPLIGGTTCLCSDNGPSNTQSSIANPSGTCAGSFFAATKLETTFDYQTCADVFVPDLRDVPALVDALFSVTSVEACFQACATKEYTLLWPNTGLVAGWMCGCFKYEPSSVNLFQCGSLSFYLFSHTAAEASQGLARRSRATAPAIKSDCPYGYDACLISKDVDDRYECLDTANELYSCGGCMHGSYGNSSVISQGQGINCEGLPGVNPHAVTCQRGQCRVWSCRRGWRVSDDNTHCVRRGSSAHFAIEAGEVILGL